jgi:hypothetical protein
MDNLIKYLNTNAGAIQAITSVLIFIVTTIYVIINAFMKNEMKKSRFREIRPVMSLVKGGVGSKENFGFPIYLFFKNIGRGIAYVSVIDLNKKNVKIDIGVPTNVGPNEETNIKIWVKESNKSEDIKLSYYYWDIDENCYRTELHLEIKYFNPENNPNGSLELYFVMYQMVKRVKSKDKKMPTEIYHWTEGNRELFEKSWW